GLSLCHICDSRLSAVLESATFSDSGSRGRRNDHDGLRRYFRARPDRLGIDVYVRRNSRGDTGDGRLRHVDLALSRGTTITRVHCVRPRTHSRPLPTRRQALSRSVRRSATGTADYIDTGAESGALEVCRRAHETRAKASCFFTARGYDRGPCLLGGGTPRGAGRRTRIGPGQTTLSRRARARSASSGESSHSDDRRDSRWL